ncbi:uncharacterized protein BO72DRAFT_139730 [Aspergillus fijiensis CBS 313.89]|uniref:Uncharacterized protein n=1 Tax=Aspergillus fijiensis CBS 313.89 TaxID=1448319 RepID=A0A8G1S433_9EURO|nr:uncharacterized protein BO72DRAFT_139730 [Aspergillus fijiensis CBS 313.89]RAK82131.1 hypothetical protein BO72DRAFT_139730 [Aspergillus fijiensis CBS 313.89]
MLRLRQLRVNRALGRDLKPQLFVASERVLYLRSEKSSHYSRSDDRMDPPARTDQTETIGTLPAGSREIPHKTAKLLSFQCHSFPPQNGARLLVHCGPAGLGVLGMSTSNFWSRQLQLTELGGFSGRCQPPLPSPVRSRHAGKPASKQPRSMGFWRTPNFPASHLLVASSLSRWGKLAVSSLYARTEPFLGKGQCESETHPRAYCALRSDTGRSSRVTRSGVGFRVKLSLPGVDATRSTVNGP